MTTERKLLIAYTTAGVFAVGGIGLLLLFVFKSPGKAHIDSPISASGGSMTFRALTDWACVKPVAGLLNVYGECDAQVSNVAYFRVDDVDNQGNEIADANQAYGKVIFYLRQASGPAWTGGAKVTLCTAATADGACDTTMTGWVRLVVDGSSTAGLVKSNATDQNDGSTFGHTVQYFDSTCHLHGTVSAANDTAPASIQACEHPGTVNWVNRTNYSCVDGGCRVALTVN
jgi:hypothetical protein